MENCPSDELDDSLQFHPSVPQGPDVQQLHISIAAAGLVVLLLALVASRLSRWRAYRQPKELVSESLRQHHSPTRTGDSGFPVHTEQGSPTFSPTAPRRYGLPAEDRSSSGSESEEDSPARTGRQQTSAAQAVCCHSQQLLQQQQQYSNYRPPQYTSPYAQQRHSPPARPSRLAPRTSPSQRHPGASGSTRLASEGVRHQAAGAHSPGCHKSPLGERGERASPTAQHSGRRDPWQAKSPSSSAGGGFIPAQHQRGAAQRSARSRSRSRSRSPGKSGKPGWRPAWLPSGPSLYSKHITAQHIEQLTSTLEFKRYMLERGLTLEEVKASERKLQLFQDLRQCDPMAFRNLCTSDLAEYDVQRALPVWLALEYVFDIAPLVCAAVLLALFGLQQGIWTKAVLLIAVANMLAWATSSSLFGRPLDLWWADLTWGHRASGFRVLAANLAEAAYVIVTLGLGGLVSVVQRCMTQRQQSFGERCLGIRLVQEIKQPAEIH